MVSHRLGFVMLDQALELAVLSQKTGVSSTNHSFGLAVFRQGLELEVFNHFGIWNVQLSVGSGQGVERVVIIQAGV